MYAIGLVIVCTADIIIYVGKGGGEMRVSVACKC